MAIELPSESGQLPNPSLLIHGDSRMAELVRAHDWISTPLGRIESWGESLLCSVNTMLACAFPSLIFWGPQMIQFYNDAFSPLLAERHPRALGQGAREFWAEAWHVVGPRLERVLLRGETVHDKRALVPILRDNRLQDVWWDYNYSPIYAPDGGHAGILVICQDVTPETIARADLRESDARAERVLRSIGDAVIVTDSESCVTHMNPVAGTLTGWTEKDAAGRPLSEVFQIVTERTRERVESPADKVRALGTIVGLANHTILISRDGKETAIDDSGAPILDEAGKLIGIVLVFRNIEEKRAAEREKERLTEQLTQLLAATTDAIVALDRDWRMYYINPKAASMYAKDREILGRNVWEAFPDAAYEGSPYVEHYTRAMDEGIPGAFEAFYPAPLDMWLRIEVFPTRDGIVTFSRDVTGDRRASETLRLKSEEAERQRLEIETVYRTAPIGLALFDTEDFRYLRLNDRQAEFFGLKPEQIVGRTLTEMAPIEGLKELFEQVVAGHPVINFPLEGRLVTNPEEHRYWTVSYFPVYAADGSIRAITAASLEVTQQKRAEKALIESEKLAVVGRLAASIAHEINNPLEAVTNLLYLAQSAESLDEIKEHIQVADRELRRAAAISNQTLRFYRQSTSPRDITCDELIDGVLSLFQRRIAKASIRVEERRHAGKPLRCFDGEIRQVLSNLLSNAIDAMQPDGGRLLLRSRKTTEWKTGRKGVALTVADTGKGIPSSIKSKIFEPFFTTKDIGGTGLGLWVSKEIVNRHQGTLRVRSLQKTDSHGTVFTMFLPYEVVAEKAT